MRIKTLLFIPPFSYAAPRPCRADVDFNVALRGNQELHARASFTVMLFTILKYS
jgi:hypothetical protein